MESLQRLGFVGLGHMGEPMAANLLATGRLLTVYDLDPARARALVRLGARLADELEEVTRSSEVVFLSLPGPPEVEKVTLPPRGLLSTMRPGCVLVNLSTVSPSLMRRLDGAARPRQIEVLDAPVTGAADGARAGTLTIMVGGEENVLERCKPLLAAMSSHVFHVGPVGAGSAAKLITNMLWFVHVVALSDALALGASAGIRPDALAEVVRHSAGASWVAEHDLSNILRGHDDETFPLALCCKDLRLIAELAADLGVAVPLAELADERFRAAAERFGPSAGELAVARLSEEAAGVPIRAQPEPGNSACTLRASTPFADTGAGSKGGLLGSTARKGGVIESTMVATRTELVAENGIVAGGHRLEAEAGVRLLEQGGNAIDAVIAAAFVGFVVEPASCGVGGYGHLAIFLADRQELITVDHYLRAPRAVRPDMFEIDPNQPDLYYGWPRVVGRANEWGHLAPGVPGAVAGLCAAHELLGRLPLAQVLEPAIEAAERGLPVTWDLALAISDRMAEIQALPSAADFLLRDGRPPKPTGILGEGDRLDLSELAGTIRRIARDGAAGFYTGPVAEAIERELQAHGGILTAGDLAAYRPKILREQPAAYRRYRYVTANDQVGYEALNILDHFDLVRYDPDSVEFRHLMAEALGHAFVDNMTHYGDPDFTRSPVNGLASRGFASERAAGIRLDRAAPRPIAPADPWAYESAGTAPEVLPTTPAYGGVRGTSQMAAADRHGNVAALITSLSHAFGSLVLVPETGVFLNNGMVNFDPRPGRPNSLAPGKMPIFAVPSLVATADDRAVFAACGSGGYRIATGVLHTMVHTLDYGMAIQAAVDAPRVHCQGDETFVDARVPAAVRERLSELGHRVVPQENAPGQTFFARVVAIRLDPATGSLRAGSGPAWSTAAAGF